jgi:hypothetical protein
MIPYHFGAGSPDSGNGGDNNCGSIFGSVHVVCHFVFCDGSVTGIRFDITPAAWAAMCSINDGVPVNPSDWE